jgi:hypothetical protein
MKRYQQQEPSSSQRKLGSILRLPLEAKIKMDPSLRWDDERRMDPSLRWDDERRMDPSLRWDDERRMDPSLHWDDERRVVAS